MTAGRWRWVTDRAETAAAARRRPGTRRAACTYGVLSATPVNQPMCSNIVGGHRSHQVEVAAQLGEPVRSGRLDVGHDRVVGLGPGEVVLDRMSTLA